MSDIGVILAIHKSRQEGDFVVLKRVTGLDYPPYDVAAEMRKHEQTGAYHKIWFQPTRIPE